MSRRNLRQANTNGDLEQALNLYFDNMSNPGMQAGGDAYRSADPPRHREENPQPRHHAEPPPQLVETPQPQPANGQKKRGLFSFFRKDSTPERTAPESHAKKSVSPIPTPSIDPVSISTPRPVRPVPPPSITTPSSKDTTGVKPQTQSAQEPEPEQKLKPGPLVIVQYKNGYVADPDGENRWFPAGSEGYEAIHTSIGSASGSGGGDFPTCLDGIVAPESNGVVQLRLIQRPDEEYDFKAPLFQGTSRRLEDNSVGTVSTSATSGSARPLPRREEDGGGRVQIRMPSGKRIVIRFSPSHTLDELCGAIAYESHEDIDPRSILLSVLRPGQTPEALTNPAARLGNLGIVGKVLVVTFK